MFKNYLITALRNFNRYRGYSLINLLGLAIGMACCIIILIYVQDEFSFDHYAEFSDRIFRVVMDFETPDRGAVSIARTPPPWAPSLADDYPEVESYVRFKTPLVSWLVSDEEKDRRFHEKGFYFADASVFEFFNLELIKGNPATALVEPRTIVLTEETARRYFGDENPIGKILRLDNQYNFEVTGLMKNVPHNSHINFDLLASFSTLAVVPIYGGAPYVTWQNGIGPDLYTYVRLREGVSPLEMERKMPEFLNKYIGNLLTRFNIRINPHLQPLTDIHLRSNLEAEIRSNSDIRYIYIFSAIALFVLLLACINFMNLATARSAGRAHEVGMRKVIGAEKKQLVFQFLGESILLACLALVVSLILVALLLPLFNSLSGKTLALAFDNVWMWIGLAAITLFVGFVAGSYPAFYLSSFQPSAVFRGSLKAGRANLRLRKFLVVFQFAISIIFIIGTGVVQRQLEYVRNKDLGFDKEHVVVLPMGDPRARQIYRTFKDLALQIPEVIAVTGANNMPGGLMGFILIRPENVPEGQEVTMENVFVDHDYVQALGIEVVEGRTFSEEYGTDAAEAFILNETAVRQLGWKGNAVGRRLQITGFRQGQVVGVIRDFHSRSLHQKIEPLILIIAPNPDAFLQLAVRIVPGNFERTLRKIEDSWREVYPLDPFSCSFLDADFDRLYRSEKQRGKVFLTFAVLAILIACLGLLGLASFTAEQRTKEIGIRKILGASIRSIVGLLSMEFIQLVLLANLIAWPAAYFIMHNWLGNFAYRISMPLSHFFFAALLAAGIALLTVSYQAVRAAIADPVTSIRLE
ncbi:MAG: ABC transporter permease [Candidatus Aminicenantes bacterium]|nr:ABC transporter permease [Candidatus Aminicenantes bacterium]